MVKCFYIKFNTTLFIFSSTHVPATSLGPNLSRSASVMASLAHSRARWHSARVLGMLINPWLLLWRGVRYETASIEPEHTEEAPSLV